MIRSISIDLTDKIKSHPKNVLTEYPVSLRNSAHYRNKMGCECHSLLILTDCLEIYDKLLQLAIYCLYLYCQILYLQPLFGKCDKTILEIMVINLKLKLFCTSSLFFEHSVKWKTLQISHLSHSVQDCLNHRHPLLSVIDWQKRSLIKCQSFHAQTVTFN